MGYTVILPKNDGCGFPWLEDCCFPFWDGQFLPRREGDLMPPGCHENQLNDSLEPSIDLSSEFKGAGPQCQADVSGIFHQNTLRSQPVAKDPKHTFLDRRLPGLDHH